MLRLGLAGRLGHILRLVAPADDRMALPCLRELRSGLSDRIQWSVGLFALVPRRGSLGMSARSGEALCLNPIQSTFS